MPQRGFRVGTPATFWNKVPEFYCIESVQNTAHNGSDVLSSVGLTSSHVGVPHCCFQNDTFSDSNFINKSGKIQTTILPYDEFTVRLRKYASHESRRVLKLCQYILQYIHRRRAVVVDRARRFPHAVGPVV